MATLTYHATKNCLKINFPEKKPLNLLTCILFNDIEKKNIINNTNTPYFTRMHKTSAMKT